MQGTPEGVEDNGSLTRVAAFPIGIDPERFLRALERVDVQSHIAELLNRYAGRKVSCSKFIDTICACSCQDRHSMYAVGSQAKLCCRHVEEVLSPLMLLWQIATDIH